jgi:hypothetical protein
MGRTGVPMSKVIENLREITWEHGNVRYGTRIKDGRTIAMWHSSDAAAIGYIVEEALKSDGFLTEEGKLSKKFVLETDSETSTFEVPTEINVEIKKEVIDNATIVNAPMAGKKCKSCGALAVVKRDGCEICDACGELGSCS